MGDKSINRKFHLKQEKHLFHEKIINWDKHGY